ncbi:MAG: hypothetical protein ACI4E1_13580 [Lachnospira sp.]
MKKSMLNVITLALVLINLVLTVILTFSLVSTNKKTNNLISKVAEIIDLDVGGGLTQTDTATSIDDIEYIDVVNNDSKDIRISYVENGKTHYAILNVTLGVNKKSKDYKTKSTTINNSMKLISNTVEEEALKYSYTTISSSKTVIEDNVLSTLRDLFETDMIDSVMINIVVQ